MLAQQTPQIGLQVDHTVAELKWADIDNGGAESVAETIARALRQLRERAEAAARAWRNELVRTAGIRFAPIWHSARGAVTGYRALLNAQPGTHAKIGRAAV